MVSWEVPDERFADCSNCHLCASDKLSVSTTKCCTYHAILPNYMLGALLSDKDEQWQLGKEKIQLKINNKIGVTPYGIAGTPDILEFNENRRKTNTLALSFEDRAKYACPYLGDGRCSIWKYRGELCITYFCHPVSGAHGNKFWNHLFQYIRYIERTLSLYALIEIGYPKKQLVFKSLEHDSYNFFKQDGSFKEKLYKNIWNRWESDEESLYKTCYDVIVNLSSTQVKQILGTEGNWRYDQCFELLENSKKNIIPDGLILHEDVVINKLNPNQYELISSKGHKIKVNMKTYLALKKLDSTKNIQDIARESKLILNLPARLISNCLENQILTYSSSE